LARFRFSSRAEADLLSIGAYTIRTWGEDQAIHYIVELAASCQMLADNPALGRSCEDIRSGLRRIECGQYVLFYREEIKGVLISGILHQRMLPDRHAIADDEP
jgi:toxin ParE1/3/4